LAHVTDAAQGLLEFAIPARIEFIAGNFLDRIMAQGQSRCEKFN
jgi:hypothetical protein